jgi:hypothetical protein
LVQWSSQIQADQGDQDAQGDQDVQDIAEDIPQVITVQLIAIIERFFL